jgi:taurine dioxygenase
MGENHMIKITPLGGYIGADVHGIDLSEPLGADDVVAITEGRLEHLVLFFRDQKPLSFEQHKALARNFGEPEITTYQRQNVDELVQVMDAERGMGPSSRPTFHADSSFRDQRPLGALLQAHIIPPRGGDTCFASMYAAYEALSPAMQAFLEGLDCIHSVQHMHRRHLDNPEFKIRPEVAAIPPLKTPVVRVHPESGRKFLNVNVIYTSHIVGLRDDESALLLGFLFDHVQRPEFGVRLHWNVGDIAFWDNWSTLHCGVPDFEGHRRLQRISILRPEANAQKLNEAA